MRYLIRTCILICVMVFVFSCSVDLPDVSEEEFEVVPEQPEEKKQDDVEGKNQPSPKDDIDLKDDSDLKGETNLKDNTDPKEETDSNNDSDLKEESDLKDNTGLKEETDLNNDPALREDSDFNFSQGNNRSEFTWNVSEDSSMYELSNNVNTLHINGRAKRAVYMLKMNPSLLTIPSWQTRYVVSSEVLRSTFAYKNNSIFANQLVGSFSDDFFPLDYAPARNFVPPDLPLPWSRSAIGSTKDYSHLTKDYEVGEGKTFFTDDSKTQEQATLQHKGEHCNIWVVDNYFTTEGVYGPGVHVNIHSVSYLGNLFDKVYPIVRGLFGEEQNFIKDRYNQKIIINDKVNIIVYDVQKDGASGGTVGFFWGKDFYTSDVYEDSNEGKFFYMDSSWVRSSIGLTASTLVHEFQHMINFSTKPSSATWYNEMLSMLCEDALHGYLGVGEERSPRNRLSMFCGGYWLAGLTNWLGGDNVLYSYAGAYAFGAFLIRNYGGVSLLKEIATNSSVNEESINEALRKFGVNKTFDQVFQEYATAVLMWNCGDVTRPSFNRAIDENVAGYQFNLPAINLGNYNVQNLNGIETGGPALLSAGVAGQVNLQPYGFSLHELGTTGDDGKLTVNFSPSYFSEEKIFVMVK